MLPLNRSFIYFSWKHFRKLHFLFPSVLPSFPPSCPQTDELRAEAEVLSAVSVVLWHGSPLPLCPAAGQTAGFISSALPRWRMSSEHPSPWLSLYCSQTTRFVQAACRLLSLFSPSQNDSCCHQLSPYFCPASFERHGLCGGKMIATGGWQDSGWGGLIRQFSVVWQYLLSHGKALPYDKFSALYQCTGTGKHSRCLLDFVVTGLQWALSTDEKSWVVPAPQQQQPALGYFRWEGKWH